MPSMPTKDPTRIYAVGNVITGTAITAKLLCAAGVGIVGSNQSIVAAITGQVIRIMGWKIYGTTSTLGGYAVLKNGSGGATLINGINIPDNTTGLCADGAIVDCGYAETSTGVGLFMDIGTANNYYNIFYITYTP